METSILKTIDPDLKQKMRDILNELTVKLL